jgi:hypothetical protein
MGDIILRFCISVVLKYYKYLHMQVFWDINIVSTGKLSALQRIIIASRRPVFSGIYFDCTALPEDEGIMILWIIGNNHSTSITYQKSWSSGMQLREPWILHYTCWNVHFCEIYKFLYCCFCAVVAFKSCDQTFFHFINVCFSLKILAVNVWYNEWGL